MPAEKSEVLDLLLLEIKEKILKISGEDTGKPVNLNNVLLPASGRKDKINITCIFINDDGNVCADMYRSGSAGSVDFICGLALNSTDEKILKVIISALDENRWSIPDYMVSEKQKKRNLVSTFRIPFLQKGA